MDEENIQQEPKKSILFINGFVLKIIAIVCMTIDHIGQIGYSMYPGVKDTLITNLYIVSKSIGRLALPLFCFLIVQGIIHTKNIKKYLTRLGIGAAIITFGLMIIYFLPFDNVRSFTTAGNIFLDLFLGALAIYFLRKDNQILKYLIPILILGFSIGSFAVKCYEYQTKAFIRFFPDFIRMQYDWFSICLIIGFYLCYALSDAYYENQKQYTGLDVSFWKGTDQYQKTYNLFSLGWVISITLIYFLFGKLNSACSFYNPFISSFAAVSGFILMFYNDKRGYNKKWFQYGCYIYYPVHLGIILLIFAIIYKVI